MVDIEKLEKAIDEIDTSAKTILKLKEIIIEINNLTDQAEKSRDLLNTSTNELKDINEKNIKSIQLNEKTCQLIDEYCTKSDKTNAKFISDVNTLMLEMKNETSSLYRNFEADFKSKFELFQTNLDRFKSDIVIENRKVTDDLKEKIEKDLQKTKEEIDKSIKENTDAITMIIEQKTNKKINVLIAIAITATLISAINIILNLLR